MCIRDRNIAEKAGIKVVPGYKDALPEDPEKIHAIANEIGYPLMIKATAGGGGRGMRLIENKDQLIDGLEVTMQEAMKMMNEIKSEYSGKVVSIIAEDGQPVEFDKTLIIIE